MITWCPDSDHRWVASERTGRRDRRGRCPVRMGGASNCADEKAQCMGTLGKDRARKGETQLPEPRCGLAMVLSTCTAKCPRACAGAHVNDAVCDEQRVQSSLRLLHNGTKDGQLGRRVWHAERGVDICHKLLASRERR
eukprot:4374326-Prymnesium_polylepis.1